MEVKVVPVIKKANELITGANGTKDLDRGIQLLISAIIDDPFSTTELTSFYKEKVINENKFIEIINIIKSKSKDLLQKFFDDFVLSNLIKGEDNNKEFLELANEILDKVTSLSLTARNGLFILASFYFEQGDFNKSEEILRSGLLRYPNDKNYSMSRQIIIIALVDYFLTKGETNKLEILGQSLLNDEFELGTYNDLTQPTYTVLLLSYIKLNVNTKKHYTIFFVGTAESIMYRDNNYYNLSVQLTEINLLAQNNQISIAKEKF